MSGAAKARREWGGFRPVWQICLVAALCIVATQKSVGAQTDEVMSVSSPAELGYSVKHWTMENGLPAWIVTSLAQTPDGFLWCGTDQGLVRYDGAKFRVFYSSDTPALRGVQILEMRCDAAGRLWIEGINGKLVVYQSGHFRRFGAADGVPSGQAGKLGESKDGSFWFKGRTNDCFYHYVNGHFEAVVYPGIPASSLDRFYADREGVQWGIDKKRRVMVRFSTAGSQFEPLSAPDKTSLVWAGRLFWLQDGSLGVTSSHAIYTLDGDQWKPRCIFEHSIAPNNILSGAEDRQGNFWVSVYHMGLARIRPDGKTDFVILPDSNRLPFYRNLLVDGEGDIWVAGNNGLYRLRYNTFRPEPASLAQTQRRKANAMVEDVEGRLWILYNQGLVCRTKAGWTYWPHHHPGAQLKAGTASMDGSLVLAYLGNPATKEAFVEKRLPDGKSERLGNLAGDPKVVLECAGTNLWVGTDEGLWHWETGGFNRVALPGAPVSYSVRGLAEDREGRLLVAVGRVGLYRHDGSGWWQLLTGPNDRGSEDILGIYVDKQNTVWMATGLRLARWRKHKWHAFLGLRSEVPRLVRNVVADDVGGLWISSFFGVTRLDINTLNAQANGQHVALRSDWFGHDDGLPSINCASPQGGLFKATDGRIWVATYSGAAVVNPKEWRQRRQRLRAPPVCIETVLADDRTLMDRGLGYGPKPGTKLLVAPGTRRIEFRYTAINLSGGQKDRFQFQLEGLGDEWVDAGAQRTAVYHRLPPGHYRFHVVAANQYGEQNEQGATLAFYLQPYWWQTLWLRIGAVMFVAGLLWLSRAVTLRHLHRERDRRREFSHRLIQSQEDERKRIAVELHDSLGQNLLIAKNQLYLAQEMAGNGGDRIQPKLKQVSDNIDAALNEARAISHQLRPFPLERLGLTKAIRSMVRQTRDSTRLPIEARIELVDALLPIESEVVIYRILQEALSNVIKHAEASQVQIVVERREQQIRVVVKDDGRGFDVETMLNSENTMRGLGLTGFEERAHLLGGKFDCQSAPGHGTTLTFEFPIPETKNGDAKN